MKRQNSVAQEEDYTFLATGAEVRRFVQKGLLAEMRGNASYRVEDVSYPYARPAVKLFVERLAPQYKSACGEKLVVTSLTRPISRQPWNAHELSVHPAGMALDLRVPRKSGCRKWLEGTLQSLEGRKVIEATRERRPAHYHIAVFPPQYERYVASLTGGSSVKLASSSKTKAPASTRTGTSSSAATRVAAAKPTAPKIARVSGGPNYASIIPVSGATSTKGSGAAVYKVRKGDTLWSIARNHELTIAELKKANGLKRSTIQPGETLQIPTSAAANTP